MRPVLKTLKLLVVTVLLTGLSACTKSPTEGIVSVVDLATGNTIPNATVVLTVNGSTGNEGFFECNESELTTTKTVKTGSAGLTEKVCFKLPAVISVAVSTGDGKAGVGTLSLVEEETTTAVVKVN